MKLFLVRHGETEANTIRQVLGQSDSVRTSSVFFVSSAFYCLPVNRHYYCTCFFSPTFRSKNQPLTERGIKQARALGQGPQWGEKTVFWRIYSSDLPRAQQTTRILLQTMLETDRMAVPKVNIDTSVDDLLRHGWVRFDARLREIAKGARQGLPKGLSYEEALQARRLKIAAGEISADEPVPLLENEDDGWNRAVEWLGEVISDALNEQAVDNGGPLNVLAVAHSGLLRVFLKRLLGERLHAHPDATFDPIDGRFAVPNTSLTILTLSCSIDDDSDDGPDANDIIGLSAVDDIDITLLTSTEHHQDAVEAVSTR